MTSRKEFEDPSYGPYRDIHEALHEGDGVIVAHRVRDFVGQYHGEVPYELWRYLFLVLIPDHEAELEVGDHLPSLEERLKHIGKFVSVRNSSSASKAKEYKSISEGARISVHIGRSKLKHSI